MPNFKLPLRLPAQGRTTLLIQLLVLPLAAPAWGLEWAIKRRREDFRFGVGSSIPYFLAVTAPATTLVLVGNFFWALVGLLYLAEMEIVSIAVSIGVAVGDRSAFPRLLSRVARRRTTAGIDRTLGRSVVAAIISFGYSIWFFANVAAVLARFQSAAFQGLRTGDGRGRLLWDCYYYSATTITTANSTIIATSVLDQLAALAEILIGLIFLIFVIAVLAGRLTSR